MTEDTAWREWEPTSYKIPLSKSLTKAAFIAGWEARDREIAPLLRAHIGHVLNDDGTCWTCQEWKAMPPSPSGGTPK